MSRSAVDGSPDGPQLRRRIEALLELCEVLRRQLLQLQGVLAPVADSLQRGVPPDDVVDALLHGGAPVARRTTQSIRDYEHALREARAAVVAIVVDEQGMTLTAAARRLGISRTVVSRLHSDLHGRDQRPPDR